MEISLKNPLRKTIFLLCSVFVHLILVILFYQTRLNLRYQLRAKLHNWQKGGIVMNMVSPLKAGIVPLTAKHKSSATPTHKTLAKSLRESPERMSPLGVRNGASEKHRPLSRSFETNSHDWNSGDYLTKTSRKMDIFTAAVAESAGDRQAPSLSTPTKQLVKAEINRFSGIGLKQLANSSRPTSQPKIINRRQVNVISPINRAEVTATAKISTLNTKAQATTAAPDSKDYAAASSLVARTKSSLSFKIKNVPDDMTAGRRQAVFPKSVKQQQESAIITGTQTREFLVKKLTERDYAHRGSQEKVSAPVTGLKSEIKKPAYIQGINKTAKKSIVPIKQSRMAAKSLTAPRLTRQKPAPRDIKPALAPAAFTTADTASNLLPTRPHSSKMVRQSNPAASTGNGFESSAIKHKMAGEINAITPATEKRGRTNPVLSAANHRSSATGQGEIRVAAIRKEYKNRFYKLGASNSLSKTPTAPLTRISQPAASIHLDIDRQNGADQPITVNKPNYSVQGRVTPGVKQLFLKVNEDLTRVKIDQGNFQAEAELADGLNRMEMMAFSASGQITKQTFSVLYVPPAIQLERKYKPSAWTTYINDRFSANSDVHAIALDKYKNKWFGMNSGVVKYNGLRWTSYTSRDGLISDKVYAIVSDQKGHLWFGTQAGVSHFDRLQWKNYTTRDGLVNNQVNAMAMDKQGNLWFGTQGGVSRFDGTDWVSYTTRDGLVSDQINAVVVDKQGNLWFGTQGGVSRFDGAKWVSYTTRDGLVSDQINAMVVDEQGNLWFGTNEGISRFDGAKWVSYTTRDGLVSDQINSVAVDKQNRLWFGTNEGVSRFDGKRWLSFNKQDGLSSNKIYVVLIESNHRKWFGTDIGISELNEAAGSRVYR